MALEDVLTSTHAPGTRIPYSWMSREVCNPLERKLCLQIHKPVSTQKKITSTRTPVRANARTTDRRNRWSL
jgi:hypothetical protein